MSFGGPTSFGLPFGLHSAERLAGDAVPSGLALGTGACFLPRKRGQRSPLHSSPKMWLKASDGSTHGWKSAFESHVNYFTSSSWPSYSLLSYAFKK